MPPLNTRKSIIESTEYLIRAKGFSALSYADLEKRIGIRKASIHYYFPAKEDLGVAVLETYLSRLKDQLESIDDGGLDAWSCLGAFAELFRESRATGALPLCGALAAEMTLLPEKVQTLTTIYLETQMAWIEKTIEGGVSRGEILAPGDARQRAFEILSLLEGASFLGWGLKSQGDIDPDVIGRILGKN